MEQIHPADNRSLLDPDMPVKRFRPGFNSTQSYDALPLQNSSAVPAYRTEPKLSALLSIILDIVLILISLLFLSLAITSWCIRNRPVGDPIGAIVEEVAKVVR